MPAVPFTNPHSVSVELLVKVVKQTNRLDDHSINLVRAELKLVSREAVRQPQAHRSQVLVSQSGDEFGELASHSS